jgi:hypothetical protein
MHKVPVPKGIKVSIRVPTAKFSECLARVSAILNANGIIAYVQPYFRSKSSHKDIDLFVDVRDRDKIRALFTDAAYSFEQNSKRNANIDSMMFEGMPIEFKYSSDPENASYGAAYGGLFYLIALPMIRATYGKEFSISQEGWVTYDSVIPTSDGGGSVTTKIAPLKEFLPMFAEYMTQINALHSIAEFFDVLATCPCYNPSAIVNDKEFKLWELLIAKHEKKVADWEAQCKSTGTGTGTCTDIVYPGAKDRFIDIYHSFLSWLETSGASVESIETMKVSDPPVCPDCDDYVKEHYPDAFLRHQQSIAAKITANKVEQDAIQKTSVKTIAALLGVGDKSKMPLLALLYKLLLSTESPNDIANQRAVVISCVPKRDAFIEAHGDTNPDQKERINHAITTAPQEAWTKYVREMWEIVEEKYVAPLSKR